MVINNKNSPSYFAKQERVFPKKVTGNYRRVKWSVVFVALAVYYITPFLRWNRGDNAPDQAVLIDLNNAKAYFFGIEIWPQEVYILTGILIFAAVTLFFVTSLFGRIWCGYLCFQTVWTDLFVWVERFIQGDRNARIRLYNAPWTPDKIFKILVTHFLWLVIALFTAGAFVLYFNDAPTLIRNIFKLEISETVVMFVTGLTLSTYIMAGFAREQVCAYMCPYARFQSAMFDRDTLIIGYDDGRGEPRGKHKKGDSWNGRGHCIDCTACVQVCPVGIDIRDGLQMECIACGLCIDACNDIMDKIGLPRGLIRYDTVNHMEAEVKGGQEQFRFLRRRTIYYASILAIVGFSLLFAVTNRSLLELHVLHDRNPLFVDLSSGKVRNGYTIKILNKTHEDRTYKLSVHGIEGARIEVNAAGGVVPESLYVGADSVGSYRIFVIADKPASSPKEIIFNIVDNSRQLSDSSKSIFISR